MSGEHSGVLFANQMYTLYLSILIAKIIILKPPHFNPDGSSKIDH